MLTTGFTIGWLASLCLSPYPMILGSVLSGVVGYDGFRKLNKYGLTNYEIFESLYGKKFVDNNFIEVLLSIANEMFKK